MARRRPASEPAGDAMRIEDIPDWIFSYGPGFFPDDDAPNAAAHTEFRVLRARQEAYLEEHGLGGIGYHEKRAERLRRWPVVDRIGRGPSDGA